MADIQWKHYLGFGPEVEQIVATARQAKQDVQNARRALVEEYEANGVLPGDKHRYTVAGLLYYIKPAFDFMKYTLSEVRTADGREFYIARPFLRNARGKELAEKLSSAAVTFDAKHELVNLLGVNCMASIRDDSPRGGTQVVWSSAAALPGTSSVIARLPAAAARQRILGNAPRIPSFLKLIKQDEYDALKAGDLSLLEKRQAKKKKQVMAPRESEAAE